MSKLEKLIIRCNYYLQNSKMFKEKELIHRVGSSAHGYWVVNNSEISEK